MFKVNDSHEIVGTFCKSAQKTVFSSFGRKKEPGRVWDVLTAKSPGAMRNAPGRGDGILIACVSYEAVASL